MAITLSAFCLAILTVSILGGLLPLATVLNHTRLQVYLSFSAGTMLGAAFFHMLPEAVRVGSVATIHWAAFGLLALFFLERFFSFHHHEPHADEPVAHRDEEIMPNMSIMIRATVAPTIDSVVVPNAATASRCEGLAVGFGRLWFDHSFAGWRRRAGERCRRRLQDSGRAGKRWPGRLHCNAGAQAGRRPDDHVPHAP